MQTPPAYKEDGDWKPAQPNDQNLGGNWWEIFQDPQLECAGTAGQCIQPEPEGCARRNITQARAVLRYYRADYYPTVTAGAVGDPDADIRTTVRLQLRFSMASPTTILSCRLTFPTRLTSGDAFARTVESYREQAQASAADLAAVNLSMHAELAIDYFQARSLDAEEQLLNSTVTQYEQALQLIQSRFAEALLPKWRSSRPKLNWKQLARRQSMSEWPARSTNTRLRF